MTSWIDVPLIEKIELALSARRKISKAAGRSAACPASQQQKLELAQRAGAHGAGTFHEEGAGQAVSPRGALCAGRD